MSMYDVTPDSFIGVDEALNTRAIMAMQKTWNTIEKGIQYLREIALVEMLYESNFVPNDPRQNHDFV